jgi:serine/threonine kinase 38
MVGTVDYIAPEVFTNDGYTETVDWWSLGTILFEMLMGYPPFYGENPTATCRKVMNFEKYFEIPSEIEVSPEAVDILKKLITRPEKRLGINGVDEIKRHPFFKNIDWNNIRK